MSMRNSPALVVLAAGMGSRYGGLKQLDPVGPNGETLLDYSIRDALRHGFAKVVFVIRRDIETAFRHTVGARYEAEIEVCYAFQQLDDMPAPFSAPSERTKPWGTGHALRAARAFLTEPHLVINADDFYGESAFRMASAALAAAPPRSRDFLLVTYRLGQTLSMNGTVNRGICRIDGQGRLLDIAEVVGIARTQSGDGCYERAGEPVTLPADTPVSMNAWGFTPEIVPLLEDRFVEFCRSSGAHPTAEFYIPALVNDLVKAGTVRVHTALSEDAWFGITYREDREAVRAGIAALARNRKETQ